MNEVRLDVSTLEPCEPMERALAGVRALEPGQWLCLQHRREPHPLYPMLQQMGYHWHCRRGRQTEYEVLIWHGADRVAATALEALLAQSTD